MSKIVELYVGELLKEGSTMTIDSVPKGLRAAVEKALEETVPAGLKDRVHEYLVEMGFYDEANEEA